VRDVAPLAPRNHVHGTLHPSASRHTRHGSRFTADRHGRGPASRLVRVPFAIVSVLVLFVLHMCAVSVRCVETLRCENREKQKVKRRYRCINEAATLGAERTSKVDPDRIAVPIHSAHPAQPRTRRHARRATAHHRAQATTNVNNQRPNSVSDPTPSPTEQGNSVSGQRRARDAGSDSHSLIRHLHKLKLLARLMGAANVLVAPLPMEFSQSRHIRLHIACSCPPRPPMPSLTHSYLFSS
jgi:hypothetical protein